MCENKSTEETTESQSNVIAEDGAMDGTAIAASGAASPETFLNEKSDLPCYMPTETDELFDTVYGDHVHDNDGSHLHGGVADDIEWQKRWHRLVVLPSKLYELPKGKVAHEFIEELCTLLEGMRHWNSEKMFVFILVVLQRTKDVRKASDIKKGIENRIRKWHSGEYSILFETTERDMRTMMSNKRKGLTNEKIHAIFGNKMLH